ncbi:MAG: site-specific DNA-methyltransferase [Candidatus Sumerlaeia bacterium]
MFFNEDCISGCRRHIADGCVDLIVTDPPYGIAGDTLHRHYHRREEFVHDGYVEVAPEDYPAFSRAWIAEAARILRPGGSLYVASGYTRLADVLNALARSPLELRNHIIWKFNFGVYTRRKWVSSHYHILYCVKPGGPVTFNTFCRFAAGDRAPASKGGGAMNYLDREDVWLINREYKPGRRKNKNELPTALLAKIIQYSSNEGDLVGDLFLGGFSTARVAIGLNRRAMGFEISPTAFEQGLKMIRSLTPGFLLPCVPHADPADTERSGPANQGRRWTDAERTRLAERFAELIAAGSTKSSAIQTLCTEFGRGRFAILNALTALDRPAGTRPSAHPFIRPSSR